MRRSPAPGRIAIYHGDNLGILPRLESGAFALIYIDPPFNTGTRRVRTGTRVVADSEGDRTGFGGRRYRTTVAAPTRAYADTFEDYGAFLEPRLKEAHRLLAPNGSFFLHLDAREVHYAKVLADSIFGRDAFMNEIIWVYDFGGRSRRKWSAKHDTILWYAKSPRRYTFHFDQIDRIPYLAPGLVGPEKALRGKTPTDVWWQTIVSPTGREKTGYPTQKPLKLLERIVRVHTNPGDTVLDFFAGSGTLGAAAAPLGRHAVLVDKNRAAIATMKRRLKAFPIEMLTT